MRRILLLGSTGSIGAQALDVIRANPDRFEVVGLVAGTNARGLAEQAAEFGVPASATGLGADAAVAIIEAVEADVVLNGITGAVGLGPTLAALRTPAFLALANKESLVIGGELVMAAAAPGQIVAVDSEHSALFQLLEGVPRERVTRAILTASGGPFRGHAAADLETVTRDDALKELLRGRLDASGPVRAGELASLALQSLSS